MKVLSLFSGIGAFELALKRIGIDVELVGFSEIDKFAIKSYCAVHGVDESLNLGDVSKIYDYDKLVEVDLITHGSPCQDFSVAGLQAGGDKGTGTRSSLMWETVRIIENVKPKYVIWENVKNLLSKSHRHNFDSYIQVMNDLGYNSYYKVLNAKDYGIPQNRERVFTISIRKDIDKGNFKFPEKQELKLRLKDMLEDEVEEKYYLSDKFIEGLIKHNEHHKEKGTGFIWKPRDLDGVASALRANGALAPTDNTIKVVGELDIKGHDCVKRVYGVDGISPTLTDMQGGNRQPKIMTVGNYMPSNHDASRIVDEEGIAPTVKENHGTVTAVAMRGRYDESGKTEQQLEISNREIANSITTVQKDSMAGEISEQIRIRKLTPLECWRLMGFSDEDFNKAQAVPTSNTQLYKQAGNSIVVNVLEAIFKKLFSEEIIKKKKPWYR